MAGNERQLAVLAEMVDEDGARRTFFVYDPNESPNERPPDQPHLRDFDLNGKAGGEPGVPAGFYRCLQCQCWINVFPKRKVRDVERPRKNSRWYGESHCLSKHMPAIYQCSSELCKHKRYSSQKAIKEHQRRYFTHQGTIPDFIQLMSEKEVAELLKEQMRRCFSHVKDMPPTPPLGVH